MTKTQARWTVAAAITAVVLLAGGFSLYVWNRGNDLLDNIAPALGPDQVAAAFHDAYQQGDTPRMCSLSTGEALTRLQGPGWCDTKQGWTTTSTPAEQCDIPNGRKVYVYDNNPLVLGQRGMEIALSDTGSGVWRVDLFGHTAGRDLCDIYR